jgi:hypothetical protein
VQGNINQINILLLVCSDYRQVLDWWLDLLDSLIQRMTTLYSTVTCTHASVHSHVFTAVPW